MTVNSEQPPSINFWFIVLIFDFFFAQKILMIYSFFLSGGNLKIVFWVIGVFGSCCEQTSQSAETNLDEEKKN